MATRNYDIMSQDVSLVNARESGLHAALFEAKIPITLLGGACQDSSGNYYVTDYSNHCILKYTQQHEVCVLAGLPGTSGGNDAHMNVNAEDAMFYGPMGICCDKSDNIYVCDSRNNQIRVIKDGKVSLFAGQGDYSSGFSDGVGGAASFNTPYGIAVDNSGIVYVTDLQNHAVRKISNNGNVLTIAGNGSSGDAENVEANSATATFNSPGPLAVDSSGNIIVADTGNFKIKKIIPKGWVYLLSGTGVQGAVTNASPYLNQYNYIYWMQVDKNDDLYLIDIEVAGNFIPSSNVIRFVRVNSDGRSYGVTRFNDTDVPGGNYGPVVITKSRKFACMMWLAYSSMSSSSSLNSSSSSSSSSNSSSHSLSSESSNHPR